MELNQKAEDEFCL